MYSGSQVASPLHNPKHSSDSGFRHCPVGVSLQVRIFSLKSVLVFPFALQRGSYILIDFTLSAEKINQTGLPPRLIEIMQLQHTPGNTERMCNPLMFLLPGWYSMFEVSLRC